MKENIKWFKNNKIDFLNEILDITRVNLPSLGCDLNQLIKENDKRLDAIHWVLYYYTLLEVNIESYKEYSKPSNYDEETLENIKNSFIDNKKQFECALGNIKNLKQRK